MTVIDQLETYLLNTYPDNFIAGTDNHNILLWGKRNHYDLIPCFFSFNIAVDYDPLAEDNSNLKENLSRYLNTQYRNSSLFKKIFDFCKIISLNSNFPCIILVYPTLPAHKATDWESTRLSYPPDDVKFYIMKGAQERAQILKGSELVSYIYELLGTSYSDKGTTKEKNRSIHDYFQFWSRNSLSKSIKKLDFDGILANNTNSKHALIEIKRSCNPPIPDWKPYVDDANNYKIQLAFSGRMNSSYWLLQHTGLEEISHHSNISFYDICGINEQMIISLYREQKNSGQKAYGDYLICRQRNVPLCISGAQSLDQMIRAFIHSE